MHVFNSLINKRFDFEESFDVLGWWDVGLRLDNNIDILILSLSQVSVL